MPKIKEMSLPDKLATMGDAYEAEARPLDKCDVEILLKAAEELRTLEAIVRALAESRPYKTNYWPDGDSDTFCRMCKTEFGDDHDEDCPYRRAVEWCAQHKEVK